MLHLRISSIGFVSHVSLGFLLLASLGFLSRAALGFLPPASISFLSLAPLRLLLLFSHFLMPHYVFYFYLLHWDNFLTLPCIMCCTMASTTSAYFWFLTLWGDTVGVFRFTHLMYIHFRRLTTIRSLGTSQSRCFCKG